MGNTRTLGYRHTDAAKAKISASERFGTVFHDGYCFIDAPAGHPSTCYYGRIRRSRLVMERYLGRYLAADELVHHNDEDKTNDSLENLAVMSWAEHSRLHAERRRLCLME